MRALRVAGELLITAGVLVLFFAAFVVWGTNRITAQEQKVLKEELSQQWEKPAVSDEFKDLQIGDGFAIIRIPRFGLDYAVVVVEGTNIADLRRGPGHLLGTALPGEIGNVVISGHRVTYGAPFNRLDELSGGDPVIIETRDTWEIYRVTEERIVRPSAIEVTYPVPDRRRATPTEALLTLTTCHPKHSARQRLVVFAALDESRPKTTGRPPELLGLET